MIRKTKRGYTVFSHSGRSLGSYATQREALHRLRQVEWWKHHGTKWQSRRASGGRRRISGW